VPYLSEPGTVWYRQPEAQGKDAHSAPTPATIAAMKGRTIRIDISDEI
jgi:hypothetical protein